MFRIIILCCFIATVAVAQDMPGQLPFAQRMQNCIDLLDGPQGREAFALLHIPLPPDFHQGNINWCKQNIIK